jgi:hypothetical protein
MKKLIAVILMIFTTVPVHVIAAPNPNYILGILNQSIANYKVLRSRGDITARQYYDLSWKAYDKAADDGNMPELREMAAFGRVKSQEFLDGKITEDQYRLAMIEQQEELKNRALAQLKMQDSGNLNWMQIVVLLAAAAALAAAAKGSTYQPYSGNCQYTWQRAADGSICGNRAASVRPGGR